MGNVNATIKNKTNNPVGRGGAYFPSRKSVDISISTIRFAEVEACSHLEIESVTYQDGADVARSLPDRLDNPRKTIDHNNAVPGAVRGQSTGGGGQASPLVPYSPETRTRGVKATSQAVALSRKENVDLNDVEHDGEKVTKEDVESHLESAKEDEKSDDTQNDYTYDSPVDEGEKDEGEKEVPNIQKAVEEKADEKDKKKKERK